MVLWLSWSQSISSSRCHVLWRHLRITCSYKLILHSLRAKFWKIPHSPLALVPAVPVLRQQIFALPQQLLPGPLQLLPLVPHQLDVLDQLLPWRRQTTSVPLEKPWQVLTRRRFTSSVMDGGGGGWFLSDGCWWWLWTGRDAPRRSGRRCHVFCYLKTGHKHEKVSRSEHIIQGLRQSGALYSSSWFSLDGLRCRILFNVPKPWRNRRTCKPVQHGTSVSAYAPLPSCTGEIWILVVKRRRLLWISWSSLLLLPPPFFFTIRHLFRMSCFRFVLLQSCGYSNWEVHLDKYWLWIFSEHKMLFNRPRPPHKMQTATDKML